MISPDALRTLHSEACRKHELNPDGLSLVVRELEGGAESIAGPDRPYYPASVVKLFFAVYLAARLDVRTVRDHPELQRAARNMIVDSCNDGTGYVLDCVCGTTPGPELRPDALRDFIGRRNAPNRWFRARGYRRLNAMHRTFNEQPYGRELQAYGPGKRSPNSLIPTEAVRLMAEVMQDRLVSPTRHEWLRSLLDRSGELGGPFVAESQVEGFLGQGLPNGVRWFSKAGWASGNRHDLGALILPDGRRFVLAAFTQGRPDDAELLPWLGGELFRALSGANGMRTS